MCVWQGLIGLTTNPVLANGIAGLATSATAHAAVEVRFKCHQKVFGNRVWHTWDLRLVSCNANPDRCDLSG